MTPKILLPGSYSDEDVQNLRQNVKVWKEVDIYQDQLKELMEIRYPNKVDQEQNSKGFYEKYGMHDGAWVYYPWSGILLHSVGPDEIYELRTNRNQNLVTQTEQAKLRSTTVGIAGMSVGAGIALGAVYSGISNKIKLADFDNLETANLNRVRETLPNIGQPKVELAAQRIYELDPFTEVLTFPHGINKDNIGEFFNSPKLDIVVDEIDDFKLKVLLRVKARENKVPLIMFTSLGDNVLIDIERYDLPNQPEIFNGVIGDVANEILNNENISPQDINRYAVQVVGINYVPTRALESLPEIGKSLVGRPQLYSTIAVDGGLAPYLMRQIILGSDVKSGRYFFKFSELIHLATEEFADTDKRIGIMNILKGS